MPIIYPVQIAYSFSFTLQWWRPTRNLRWY